jgi:cardiolipin synthase
MSQDEFQFFTDGDEYQDFYVSLIESAQETITIQTYIFKLDGFGSKVYEAIVAAAKRDVKISIVVDYFGSIDFNREKINHLNSFSNVDFVFFNSFSNFRLLQFGRRLHHKVLVIDSIKALVGGINIIDYDFAQDMSFPRLDFALKVSGSPAAKIEQYSYQIFTSILNKSYIKKHYKIINPPDSKVKVLTNDWYLNRKEIKNNYATLIRQSRKSITLIHGYFFPSMKIVNLLKQKSAEGVDITLVLPLYSDWTAWIWATKHLYKKLFNANIEVLVWEKSTLHGKLGIFDNKIVTIGSHNLNYTSSFGNLEMNIQVKDSIFTREIIEKVTTLITEGATKYISRSELTTPLKVARNFFFYLLLLSMAQLTIFSLGLAKFLKKSKT